MSSVKEIEKNKVKVEFEISDEAMKEASLKAYHKNKGKFNIPGFRKGHAPKAVIEKFYGEQIFFEDAFELAFPEAYSKAIEEQDIFAVSRPENVDIVSMEEDKPIVVSAEVYVKPEVELGAYQGITVQFQKSVVTDEDVENEVKKALEQNARFEDVDREAAMGDKVVLDYSGSVDGEKFDGGTAEAQTLDLGSGMFIPGFEEQIVGMKAGEQRDITVTFPEEYHAENLSGKEAVFAIKLIAVKEKQVPEADDEFAQDVSEFDTFEEYKADLKKKLEETAEQKNKYGIENAVIKKIVENAKVDIPECMVESQIDYQLQEMEYSMMYQGINMQQYLEYTGMTMEDLRKQYRDPSADRVKTRLVMEAIRDAEKIEADEQDVEKEIAEMAKAQKKELEEYKKGIKPDEMEYIKDRANYEKLISFLVSGAKITKPRQKKAAAKDEGESAKKTPAKKTAAKKKPEEPAIEAEKTEAE